MQCPIIVINLHLCHLFCASHVFYLYMAWNNVIYQQQLFCYQDPLISRVVRHEFLSLLFVQYLLKDIALSADCFELSLHFLLRPQYTIFILACFIRVFFDVSCKLALCKKSYYPPGNHHASHL